MRISELSIRNPVFAWMLMAALILFGWISFQRMGISQLPDVDFPVVTVSVSYEGAAPEVLEADVVDPVEDALMTVQGVRTVTSVARYGQANITVEFELNREIDAALQEVQSKVAQTAKRLPREIDPPVITKTNPDDQPILWLALSSDRHTSLEMMRFVRDQLKDKFSTVGGVGEVVLGGYVEPALRVWVKNPQLNRFELSVGDILSSIQSEHSELPAGEIESGRKESKVRTMGEARGVDEFSRIVINRRGNQPNFHPLVLADVARVEEGLLEVRRLSRYNGQLAIGLGIKKQRGSNAVAVGRAVKAKMVAVNPQLPAGMKLEVNFDTTRFIEQSIHGLNLALVFAAIFTGLVCWAFLGSWTSTVNVLMSIPTSIVGAFMALYALGFTLNTFTLLGLALAIGIVVDDAIMVLENIVRHREMGKSRLDAAREGSFEITFAALAATVAIVAIFLPVAFMRGVIGKFFFQFGITMTVTVLLSLLEALTLTPMRCSQFVEPARRTTRIGRAVEALLEGAASSYNRLLGRALHRPWLVLLLSLGAFAISLVSYRFLNKEFVPAQDQSVFIARYQGPVDSSLSFTSERGAEIEKFFAALPEVAHTFIAVGGMQGGEVSTGLVFVSLKEIGSRPKDPKLRRERTQLEIMGYARQELRKLKDVRVSLQDLSMRGFTASRGYPVEFSVRGPDWEALAASSRTIMNELEKTQLVTDLDSDYKLGAAEIHVVPDRIKAAQRGVSVVDISRTVNALVGGVSSGRYAMGGHRYDIRVRLESSDRGSMERIGELWVRNNRGELVRLSEVVRLEEKPSLQQITRYDRERAVTVFANVKPGASQAAALAAAEEIGKRVLPEGYRLVMSGSAQTFKESFQDLVFALLMGIVVAYMVLGSQFNSFLDPVTVLMALPFSLSGAFIALAVSGQSLSIYSFIGLILLMGIVKKNSILLVEFTHQVRSQNPALGVKEALLAACPIRLRPILMTSVATIAAAVPEALAPGAGAETRVPMAVCVIGGVLVSTLLTLLVVPCVYLLFDRAKSRFAARHAAAGMALIGMALFGTSVEAAPHELSLSSALQMAMELNPALQGVREKVIERGAAASQSFSAHFPTVQAVGLINQRKDAVIFNNALFGGEPYMQYSFSLQGSLPIYHGGSLAAAVGAGKQDERARKAEVALLERTLALEVSQAWLDSLLYGERRQVFQEQIQIQEEVLKTARARERIGRSQRIDVLQIETQLALLRPQLEQARVQYELAVAKLGNLLGEKDLFRFHPAGKLRGIPVERLKKMTFEPHEPLPELERSQALRAQVDELWDLAWGRHLPQIDVLGNWGRSSFSKADLLDSYATSWNVGLQVTIPLLSGLSSFQERRMFASQRTQAERAEESTRAQVALQQTQDARGLDASEVQARGAEEAYRLSRQLLQEARKSYALSVLDYQQLLLIQKDSVQAELSWHQSKRDLALALIRWAASRGASLRALVLELDETMKESS